MGRTYKSIIVDAPIDKVWDKLRNFHDLSWAPAVIEDLKVVGDKKSDQVGAQRLLNGVFAETLHSINDLEHKFMYVIDDAQGTPVAKESVKNYVGTVQAHEVTEGNKTFVTWQSTWDENVSASHEFCSSIYAGLLGQLQKNFE